MGPPGSGKGTQASRLSNHLNIPHIDTGSMLREEIAAQTEEGKIADKLISKGYLAPVSLVVKIIKNRLSRTDTKKGFILDGFPRSVEQAEGFEIILKESGITLSHVLNINVDEHVLLDRMAYRKSCANCGAKYNLKLNPPKKDHICDICSFELAQRADDNVQTAIKRIATYKKETEPLIEYYSDKKLLRNIDGNESIEKIFANILKVTGIE